jgi:hypothetical protein
VAGSVGGGEVQQAHPLLGDGGAVGARQPGEELDLQDRTVVLPKDPPDGDDPTPSTSTLGSTTAP